MKITKLFIILSCLLTLGAFASGCGSGYLTEVAGTSGGGTDGEGSYEQDSGGSTVMSVESVYPLDGSRGVVLGTSVSITFDVSLLASSIPGNVDVLLTGPVPSISVPTKAIPGPLYSENGIPGTASLDDTGKIVTFTADDNYTDCSIFQIVVTGGADGVESTDGTHLAENFTSDFLSACPGIYTWDSANYEDIGYSVHVTSNGKMYVGGGVMTSDYSYAIWVNKLDVVGDYGPSEWSGGYIQNVSYGSPTFEMDAANLIYDESTDEIFTAGWSNSLGWFQKLDSEGTGQLGGGTGIPLDPVISNASCRGLARSPMTGDFAVACLDAGVATVSFIWILDSEGNIVDYASFADLWGNNSMFKAGAFDADGNLYVTLAPYYFNNLHTTDYLRIIRFNADEFGDLNLVSPDNFAVFSSGSSVGRDINVVEENGQNVFYVAGYIDTGGPGGVDALLVKFTALGAVAWSITHNGAANMTDAFNAVTVDAGGNVYVTGFEVHDSDGGDSGEWWDSQRKNMILHKYTSAGVEVFALDYSRSDDVCESAFGNDVFVDDAAGGEIYVAGTIWEGSACPLFGGPTEMKNVAVWRYDNDGVGGD